MTHLSRSLSYRICRYSYRFWHKTLRLHAKRPVFKNGSPLTVVLPVIAKDLDSVAHTLAGIRKHVCHPIDRIILVSPKDEKIAEFARRNDVEHLLETDMLSDEVLSLNAHTKNARQIGWIRQQMIKMHANEYFEAERVLVCDSDTVIIRDLSFETPNRKMILWKTEEYRPTYADMIESLLGYRPVSKMNHVAHVMVFDRACMRALKAAITQHCGENWLSAVKKRIETGGYGDMAEYELYAAFARHTRRDDFTSRYWYNKKVSREDMANRADLAEKFRGYNFISSHIH